MPDPEFTFSQEKMTLTITGLTGWKIGELDGLDLKLLDRAQIQFPTSWSKFKAEAALTVFDAQWKLHGRLLLKQTLEAGIDYTLKDGTGASARADSELVLHLLERQATEINLQLNVQLEGKATRDGYTGSALAGIYLGGRF